MASTSSSSSSSSSTSSLTSSLASSNLVGAAVEVIASGVDILATELADELAQSQDDEYTAFEAAAEDEAVALYNQQFVEGKRLVKAALIPRTGESAPHH
jgi:hypothetical protein